MNSILLFYLVAQLLSTAYGLAVIESIKPFAKAKLYSDGYKRKNRNSLYKFSDTIIGVLKGFIPFYYTFVAVSLVNSKDPINEALKKELESGDYISPEEEEYLRIQEENKVLSIAQKPQRIEFEKPEKYVARKNDNSLYDTYITPIEYVIDESKNDEELSITPFLDKDRIVEHVYVKDEINKSDIAKAISELDCNELDTLISTLEELSKIKKRNQSLTLKDAA